MEKSDNNFQSLIPEDKRLFSPPKKIWLDPPLVDNQLCIHKRNDWIKWRAAPYEAKRHSEYLFIPEMENGKKPNILISAVMPTPISLKDYLKTISRKRRYDILGKKAEKAGYTARSINPAKESKGIWEIIHSSEKRQGRRITRLYSDRPPDFAFPTYRAYGDPNYDDICCGVFSPDGQLVAYLLGKRVGHHVQYDEIMGHSDHLKYDTMYFLHISFLELCIRSPIPPQCLNYGPWYSGENPFSINGGLNRWKRKVKFKPAYLILASS